MKRIVSLCLVLLLSLGSIGVYAKPKTKPFTKKYRNEKLIVVLNDLCKRNGYTLVLLDDIDANKRITANFQKAKPKAVLRKVLDQDYQYEIKKNELTISLKPKPANTWTVRATEPYRIDDNDSLTSSYYMDTVYTVQCENKTVPVEKDEKNAPENKRKRQGYIDTTGVHRFGHNIQLLVGGAYSSMGYQLGNDGQEIGSFGGNVQLRYLYYFTPNWGIGAGIGFSNYGSTGTLNTTTVFTPDQHDSDQPFQSNDGEAYEHRVTTHDWQEKQGAYMIDVPVMIQCTYPIKKDALPNGHLKLYADLGVDLGFNVSTSRQLIGGSIEHSGWYAPWKLELEQINGHDFYTEQAEDFDMTKRAQPLKLPSVGLMADLGLAFPLTTNIDLLVGLYANYTANNICARQQDIGWRHTDQMPEYSNHSFMNDYEGLIGTQYAQAVHPWQAGLRVGINFNIEHTDGMKKKKDKDLWKRIEVCDTTSALEERVETIEKPVSIQQIKRVLDKSVIWFDVNSTEPKLEPADILIQVAEILKENPEQKILITGHASREGNKEYNQRLSEGRAKAVVDILLQLGVSAEQMESRGEGVDRDYIQGDHSISLDRRVEITPVE